MIKGTNILWGTGVYAAALWALYGTKAVTFKDQKEVEKTIPLYALRAKAEKDYSSAEQRVKSELVSRGQKWVR